jgi:catechol 2,3-dioxygenase-like lactoylglutathione lyase family enzyme
MKPIGVHHVSINVRDVERATAFYCDVLGLSVRPDRPSFSFGGTWLDVGGQQIHLIEGDVPSPLGQHFALTVDDLDGVVAELRSRGVSVTELPPLGNRQAFLSDPEGNAIELTELRPG